MIQELPKFLTADFTICDKEQAVNRTSRPHRPPAIGRAVMKYSEIKWPEFHAWLRKFKGDDHAEAA